MSILRKRSFTLHRHRTSIALENIFWDALEAAAQARGVTTTQLLCDIDEARNTSLASAIRVWLYQQALAGQSATDSSGIS